MFHPYHDSLKVIGSNGDNIEFIIEGSQSYSNGGFGGERNAEIEITVSKEQAKEIRDDLNSFFRSD